MIRLVAILLGVLAALPALAQPSGARATVVTVGTGPFGGTYYPVGRALCQAIDREAAAGGMRCSAEPTPGSVYNLRMLREGELDFALVQADTQFAAIQGGGAEPPFRGLRSLFALYDEAFVVIAAPGAGIERIEDLRARRVNTGSTGSGTRGTWDALAAVLGWQGPDQVRGMDSRDIGAALCARAMDASVMVGFQPAAALRSQLSACETHLVPVTGPAVAALLRRHPYYRPVSLPAATYGTPGDIETFGVSSDFVTTDRADPRVVSVIVRAVVANLEDIAAQSPALARLRLRGMVGDGLTAPLHPAAAAIYRELGLIR
ncbi:TAXI family TRAP transporter solute-binding subunit [Humitalea sp. 24SJ18S-53]|uniref:TAXI family TRAP transporter solute-binding subunit n=1 Tax=Humitalea sp. 24SJ18S-53 TaxID=3422307 RepID=UPI003D66FADB